MSDEIGMVRHKASTLQHNVTTTAKKLIKNVIKPLYYRHVIHEKPNFSIVFL